MNSNPKRGQATVEFAVVIAIFTLVVFGAIEASRAVFERHSLARAAETIVQELAQTDPSTYGTSFTTDPSSSSSSTYVTTAIADANTQAHLGLSTTWPASVTTSTCSGSSCEIASNSDGSVQVIGIPNLEWPDTIKVTVRQLYSSFLGYPLPISSGYASETVGASTLSYQLTQ